ncbi:ATP-binding cassette domain-containing protein [Miniphocaeibacter halophilus]|uniref:ABC transporter ATP-binding protein n=1 Tax=Miniphocaeibacter halophilus TaxID=2931922 RepID=A0AC61MSV3_9FIRM|nr:ATP-binding cassette domain-containing protein [Miniphocaeibacter halophilus]QQK08667.1 ABC transporter ATP-binding protein [Miniphocaeibacter halophilus]
MIECKNISKEFNKKILFKDLNFKIGSRGIYSIIGPSGCGKTTLARIIMGLEELTSGVIEYSKKIKFSTVFPENRLIPNLNTFQNINYVVNNKNRTRELLKTIEMENDGNKYPKELSNGMKRRVSFARGFGYKSDLFVLDEPFNGLDLKLKNKIIELLKDDSTKRAILLIDHDIETIRKISKEVLELDKYK